MAGKKLTYKNKKFYYRRAEWTGQEDQKLEDILIDAHKILNNVGKRTFTASKAGAQIRGANFKDEHGLYLQITSYVPGQSTSLIDKSKSAKKSDVSAQVAPDKKEYVDGEAFVYIKDNDVIFCTTGTAREKVLLTYICRVLSAVDEKEIANNFELSTIADVNKLQMIRDEGVDKIDLNISLYEASLIHMDRNNPTIASWQKGIANQVMAIFGKDKELKEIKENENVNVGITLKYDGTEGRKKNNDPEFGVVGKKRLEQTAAHMISEFDGLDDSGFFIITGSGNKITADDIRVSESLRVETLGISLARSSAWSKLKSYHSKLESKGILQQ